MKSLGVPIRCVLIALVMAWAGCQTVPPPVPIKATPQPPPAPVSPEEALRGQVARFWDARIKGDLVKQYDLLEPEARERVTLTAFVRSRGTVDFKSHEIQAVNVVGDKGWAKVKYTFAVRMPQLTRFGSWSGESTEVWVLRNDLWYRPYNQKEAQNPPASLR
jgi:hypothetical protein